MKNRTINGIIAKKITGWVDTIEDKDLQGDILDHIIVTGGAITSLLLNERANDFDVYFDNKDILKRVIDYYVSRVRTTAKLKVLGVDSNLQYSYSDEYVEELFERYVIMVESIGLVDNTYETASIKADKLEGKDIVDARKLLYEPVFISSNAITLSNDIQLIVRFFGDCEEIHKNFDFVHCTNYWTFDTGIVNNIRALEATLAKELFYCGSRYPLASIIRTKKFIGRGWHINAGQYLKMAIQVNNFNLTDPRVLADQLVGVDLLYFSTLIEALKTVNPEDLTGAYIIRVIDKIF